MRQSLICWSSPLLGQFSTSSWFLQVIYLNTHYAVGLPVEMWVLIGLTSVALGAGTCLAGACPFLAEWTPWGSDNI